ncbi:alpha/beta fold hydrolase [Rhizobium sp. C4]|uniref:alpha/beta fold hydrolase n=1 Tax=Rhizobium sp. C4 TaxID=1349800 RepID=UPI001E5A1CBE|nr:alpha/beta fold hydrolase [Rhizobium sp. C4]MCD2175907.1 alpha/beta fold hydrolase [Rhizobium sp. C4]
MEDRTIRIDGIQVRYRQAGNSGPVLLCIHGIAASLEVWEKQLEGLSDRFRVIALDLPGHGLSEINQRPFDLPDFAEFCWHFLDALGMDNAFILGNSMGGGIALLMAGQQPERAQKIILAAAASLGRRSPLPFRLMTLPLLGEIMNKPGKAAVDQQLHAIFFDQACVTAHIRDCVTRNVFKPGGATAFLKTLRTITDLGGQRQVVVQRSLTTLRSLRMPVLFIHGRQDAVLIVDHSIEAQKLTSNSRIILLEECGHTPQWEKPSQFNTATAEFLSS